MQINARRGNFSDRKRVNKKDSKAVNTFLDLAPRFAFQKVFELHK
jgi:hypothetical protein